MEVPRLSLSDAIRLGSLLSDPGITGEMFEGGDRCALGAACDAVGLPPMRVIRRGREWSGVPYTVLEESYPILKHGVRHPLREERVRMTDVIWELNDSCGWTRWQIAQWVEWIERIRPAFDAKVLG
jgi:hypothetical protein